MFENHFQLRLLELYVRIAPFYFLKKRIYILCRYESHTVLTHVGVGLLWTHNIQRRQNAEKIARTDGLKAIHAIF